MIDHILYNIFFGTLLKPSLANTCIFPVYVIYEYFLIIKITESCGFSLRILKSWHKRHKTWMWLHDKFGLNRMMKWLENKWYDIFFYIQNVDIRGRLQACSCPSWPKSLLPLEYTLPATKNNVCSGPHEMESTFAAICQSNSRGVKTCSKIYKHSTNAFQWSIFLSDGGNEIMILHAPLQCRPDQVHHLPCCPSSIMSLYGMAETPSRDSVQETSRLYGDN